MKKLLLVLPALGAVVIGWGILRKNTPPPVSFARVERQTLVSTLPTNGKVEPFEWQAVRAETAGLVTRVPVREGQTVAKGAVLAEITDPSIASDVEAATARVAEARANLAALEQGGKSADLSDIQNSLARAHFDLARERKNYEPLKRLLEKQAATPMEVQAEADKIRQLEIEIDGLEKRRAALVGKTDVEAAKARLADAGAALKLARQHAAQSVLRAPLSGEVYGLEVRPGAWLAAGDLVANVGRLDQVRVRVYVDEPLLGRVAEGEPVIITWEALAGKQWHGTVEHKPASIQTMGSRQVGEVVCTIQNPSHELIPGTNVDAEIRTAVVDRALVIPKETLRHDARGDFVFLLKGDVIERRQVQIGISTVTQAQIAEGLAEGDAVAIPADTPLKPGARVTPVF